MHDAAQQAIEDSSAHSSYDSLLRSAASAPAAWPPMGRLAAGSALGPFRIDNELGRGGMGVVYSAWDAVRSRRVALKVLTRNDLEAQAQFMREFHSLANVRHPNLILPHDLFTEPACMFSMELVEGVDFLTWSRGVLGAAAEASGHHGTQSSPGSGRSMGEVTFKAAFAALVDAISALHAARKLHLDLKPSNVLVSGDGVVKVVDLGLCRELAQHDQGGPSGFFGTPSHASPEQARGDSLSAASDWYSLGVVLYQVLTGELPFRGSRVEMLRAKCERDPIRPGLRTHGVSRQLERLCLRMLSRDPRLRPGGDEIRHLLAG